MLADKSNGTLWNAILLAMRADELKQDERVDAGSKAFDSIEGDGNVDKANAASYREMLHDIRNGVAHRLCDKLSMWNAESYTIEIHPYSERDGMFPVCWIYRENHRVWGGLVRNPDGHYSSHQ